MLCVVLTGEVNHLAVFVCRRVAVTKALDLEKAGVKATETGLIDTDEYCNTSAEGVYAVGDVLGKADLTPVAIQAGSCIDVGVHIMHCE